ncbi:uncharacterized protein LY89DRAFT_341475 [Mollisia scopiformis]|uniref:Uncharacterized protein n=1 Tax=Mollisia scopiformis TaxID=149040 RepID=A0A132B7G2_MOLSC|nr:uncharacterized protein LY89DRAFT_341475 [Mollisia scopiformis]KUJ08346.1 hypothetical protein LY89DRAFT_341475 [Mollisia scopiformis]
MVLRDEIGVILCSLLIPLVFHLLLSSCNFVLSILRECSNNISNLVSANGFEVDHHLSEGPRRIYLR